MTNHYKTCLLFKIQHKISSNVTAISLGFDPTFDLPYPLISLSVQTPRQENAPQNIVYPLQCFPGFDSIVNTTSVEFSVLSMWRTLCFAIRAKHVEFIVPKVSDSTMTEIFSACNIKLFMNLVVATCYFRLAMLLLVDTFDVMLQESMFTWYIMHHPKTLSL